MLIAELALQGVRGFSPAARVPLKPGYWVLRTPSADAPLSLLCLEMCFPSGTDRTLMAPGAQAAKAGLVMIGNDQAFYRLIRELGVGAALHQCKPPSQAYELLTTDPAEITQLVRAQVGLPDRAVFSQLFCFSAKQLPSRKPASAGKAPVTGSTSAWAEMLDAKPSADPSTQLQELERELALSQEVEQIQFQADGVGNEIFQTEDVLRGTEPVETKLAELKAALANAPTPEKLGLPGDLLNRVERMPAAQAKLDEGLAKLKTERSSKEVTGIHHIRPIIKVRPFWAGIGLGMVALILGAVTTGPFKYLAVLNMFPLGFSGLLAWRYLDDLEHSERASKKGDRISEREKKLREQYAIETAAVRAAMVALKLDEPAEIVQAFALHSKLSLEVQQAESELVAMRQAPDYAAAVAKLKELKVAQDTLQAQLADKGSYVRDLREVQRDLAKAKAALGGAKGGAAPSGPVGDPTPALLAQAANLFATDLATVSGLLKDRTSQYFIALTERRFTGLEFSATGFGVALGGTGKTPLAQLAPKDVDLAYLALRFTLLEKYCARFKVPILVESSLETVDEAKAPLLARMLKNLGTLGQVLHVTANPAFAQAADGVVNA